jgi:hypothetical protein
MGYFNLLLGECNKIVWILFGIGVFGAFWLELGRDTGDLKRERKLADNFWMVVGFAAEGHRMEWL